MRKIFILIIAVLFSQNLLAQAGWVQQISGITTELRSISFANQNTGYAIGNYNVLLKTTNSGLNWISGNWGSYSSSVCFKIFAQSADTLYAAVFYNTGAIPPYVGLLIKSIDGGGNWFNSYYRPGAAVVSFSFMSNATGWLCEEFGNIKKTTDHGLTWTAINSPGAFHLYNINFINNSTGLMLSDSSNQRAKFHITTNGGTNWSSITLSAFYHGIYFNNETTGYIYNGGALMKTTNSGFNWRVVSQENNITSLEFVNENTGWCCTGNSAIMKSTNSGENWFLHSSLAGQPFKSLDFVNENFGWVAGDGGVIFRTTNGGVSVSQIASETPDKFSLSQNYPNPFNPSTKINYEIKSSGFVNLKVFDLLGKEVATLVNEKQNAGSYAVDFNSSEFNLPSGIYFYTLNAGKFNETRKMVLVK